MENFAGLMPLILLLILFYFLIYRPQTQQQKKRKELLSSLREGDKIRTISGVYGSIEKVKEDELIVKVADNVRIRLARFGVESVIREKE